jgi:hypothetical protein
VPRSGAVRAGGPGEAGSGLLLPGLERIDDFVVEDRLLTDVGGTIGARVLSTPGMIAMMERNAAILVFDHLEPGQATVGSSRCASSTSPRRGRAPRAASGRRCGR